MPGMRYQPQGRAQVRPEWIAKGVKFAYVPRSSFVDAVSQGSPAQVSGTPSLMVSPAGKTYAGGARAEFDTLIDARNGLTILAIIRSADGPYVNTTRALASSRTAGNGGWNFARGGSSGGFGRQQLVFQAVATYNESSYGIDPAVDTPIACRYDPATGRVTFFRFGVQTTDLAGSAPRAPGALVVGAQGPYSSNLQPWVDQSAGLIIVEGALTDAEIGQLTSSTAGLWQVFASEDEESSQPSVDEGVQGTLASQLAGAAMSSTGLVVVAGSLSSSLANASMAAFGTVGNAPSGSFASQLAGASMTAAGAVLNRGVLASTLDGASLSATGVVAAKPTGAFASTLDGASMYAAGYIGSEPPANPVRAYRWRVMRRHFSNPGTQ